MPVVSLDDLGAAYRRVQRSIARSMEDAADFNDNAVFDALVRDQNIVDAAFFVLIFGQLENRITTLAIQKVPQEAKKNALREAKFEKRLEIALRGHADLISMIVMVRESKHSFKYPRTVTPCPATPRLMSPSLFVALLSLCGL